MRLVLIMSYAFAILLKTGNKITDDTSDMVQAAPYHYKSHFTLLLLNDEGVCWCPDSGNNNDKMRTPFARINPVDPHATSSNHVLSSQALVYKLRCV